MNKDYQTLYNALIKDLEFLVESHTNAVNRERDRQEAAGLSHSKWSKYIDGINALNHRVQFVLESSREREKDYASPTQKELPLD